MDPWYARRPSRTSLRAIAVRFAGTRGRDLLVALALFLTTFTVFRLSPVGQVGDSNYSMLLSETLLTRHTFALDAAIQVRTPVVERDGHFSIGDEYPLVLQSGHVYYFFPPGSSILSVPFVATLRLFGYSTMRDGAFHHPSEVRIQRVLAALLMAAFVVLVYVLARHRLGVKWATFVAATTAFGTSVWSTASRAMWSDTWGLVLMILVVLLVVRHELHRRSAHPVLLATLLAFSYVVRPTAAVAIVVLALHLLSRDRKAFVLFAATMLFWIGLFVVHSERLYGAALPPYFALRRLGASTFGEAFAANLVSPGRGLLVYSSFFAVVGWATIRARRELASMRLVGVVGAISALHLLLIASFPHWWGGHSYGPRFCTALVPWLTLVFILALEATLRARDGATSADRLRTPSLAWMSATFGVAIALSVLLHAGGAIAQETWRWNDDLDRTGGAAVWSWRHAQFLAPLQEKRPAPVRPMPVGQRIAFGGDAASVFLGDGWSGGEESFRWTAARQATLAIGEPALSPEVRELSLSMKLSPYVPPQLASQRLEVSIDDTPLVTFVLRDPGTLVYVVPIPRTLLRPSSVLQLRFPDAASPASFGESDPRLLGAAFHWIELRAVEEP